MTIAYKIALGAALLLLLFVSSYYFLQDEREGPQTLPSSSELAELVREEKPGAAARPGVNRTADPVAGSSSSGRLERQLPEERGIAAPSVRSAGLNADELRSRLAAAQQAAQLSSARTSPASDVAIATGSPVVAEPRPAPAAAPSFDLGAGSPAPARTAPPVPRAALAPRPAPTPASAPTAVPTVQSAPRAASGATASSSNAASSSAATAGRAYVVQSGDTLERIAERLYGEARHWQAIAQANPRVDPIKLRIGQELRLPEAAELTRRPDAVMQVQGEVSYVVRSGDTLSSIAKQFYGEPNSWPIIFNANQELIGRNSNRIKPGMKLQIPAAPQPAR